MINKKSSLFSLIFLFSQFLHYFASFNIPFGVEEGDELINFSDKPQISRKSLLNFPFKFFERKQNLIFISANGAVSFVEPFDPKTEDLSTEHKDIIAVFYAPSSNGNIFYRSSQTENLLSRELSAKVRRAFGANQFEASSVLLVSWNDLLNEKSEANTFQLALVADSNETYAIFVFGTINWTKSGGRLAQTGFFSIDGRNDKVLDQGNSAGEVSKGTNFNEPGIYIYRISGNEPTDPKRSTDIDDYEYQQENPEYEQDDQIIECPPDPFRDKCPPTCNLVMDDNHCSLCICSSVHSSSSENLAGSAYSTLTNDLGEELPLRNQRPQPAIQRASDLSCAPQSSISQCHSKAICIQYKSGYCCECEKGYIGNGVECILQDEALRINGVFEAVINGKSIQKTELFSFIQPNEGQQHTALAKINSEIVWSLLLVDSLSSSFGWLFAKTSSKQHKNGFQLTGGNFTRIVNIYLGERYLLVIRQEFSDRQFSDQFNVNVILSGTLPEISGPVQVSIPEFEENYRKEKPGMLRSYSERYILFRGVGSEEQKFRVTVDQQIHFTECPHNLPQDSDSFTVKYERISSSFKEDENVVRFASQSSIINEKEKDKNEGKIINYNNDGINIEQNSNTQDPCSSGRHFCNLPNMLCVQIQINPGYRCECKPGFRLIEDNNVEQRMTCQLVDKLENIVLPAPSINPSTSLQPGECNRHDQCHQWGECVFGPIPGFPGKCKCRGWYVGDGLNHCGPPDQQQQSQQPSQNTVGITPSRGEICHKNEECGDNAKCEYSAKHGYWICFCLDGYYKQGEGSEAECLPEQKKEQKHEQKNNLNSETNQNNVGENVLQTHDNNPSAIIPTTRKQCSDATDCHPFGSCLLSEQTNAHFCFCLPGYQGDGVEKCELSEECSPTDIHGCPFPNQECRFEHSLRKFACQCKDGFTKQKDGKCLFQSTESLPISSIDRCKQCGTNSKCVQEKQKQSEGEENIIWNCICNTGYTGNGFECREENCLDLPQMCSANAQCLPDASKATYLCICNYGYSGDGKICEPIYQRTKDTPDKLLIGRGMAIIQRSTAPNLDESGRQLIVQQHQTVVAIDYDCISERIYWSDISGHSIRSAYLNGTEITSSYSDLLRSPEGIAIDWRSQNIYYVDSIKNELGVVSIDGKFQRTLLKEGLNNPRALVIDMESRQLFYSDWSRDAPKIGRIGLDGSGNKVIISDEILLPNGLVMLQYRRWLCWVDAGNQRLTCSALDGSNRKVIYAPLEYPFGLTVDSQEDRFYWTDWKDQKIHSVDIFGKGYTEFFPGAGGRGKLYGILSLPVKCHFHKAPSECIKKGNCAHWCLPGSQIGEFTCVCPENINGLDGC